MVMNKFLTTILLLAATIFGFKARVFPVLQLPSTKGVAIQQVIAPEDRDRLVVELNKTNNLVEFRDQAGMLIVSFLIKRLALDKYFPITEKEQKWDSLHIDFAIRNDNTFFFPVTRSIYCGANNCRWGLYVYQPIGKLDILAKNIFGNIQQILLSPDKTRIAVLSYVHGGYCSNGSYLYLLDRAGKKTIKVNSLNLENYSQSQVEELSWEGDTGIKAKVLNSNCFGLEKDSVDREVKCRVVFDSDQIDCKEI